MRPGIVLFAILAAGPLASVVETEQATSTNCSHTALGDLDCLGTRVHNSWIAQLTPDPEQWSHVPNQRAREVGSGHYVLVHPSPLPEPYLVAFSSEMAELLGIDPEVCSTTRFVKLFSGAVDELASFGSPWATPYALSIYGSEMVPNGAGRSGNGYGDGRAISIAEVIVGGARWELQLKGSGPTPFCRGSDGRAVLRSSVREFLVSEAMYHLGVPTTRALSLVASGSEHVQRPWYSGQRGSTARSSARGDRHGGDVMQEERCAMTTRVAPSFLRVGHFELFGRRARRGDEVGKRELEQLAKHALFREYAHLVEAEKPLQQQILDMVAEAAERFARMAAEWLRVGYVQSNFNADNCLISGRTMDYGPFGFIEHYDPKWAMWIGSGEHFSFMNQPRAARENFRMFAESLAPLLDTNGTVELKRIIDDIDVVSHRALSQMWARKLGLRQSEKAATLWDQLEPLLRQQPSDYTIFWRQLSDLPMLAADLDKLSDIALLEPVELAFDEPLSDSLRNDLVAWLRLWLAEIRAEESDLVNVTRGMRQASPRFIPRESMLVDAYTAAQQGDHSVIRTLQELFRHPYDEQTYFGERYYNRRKPGADSQGGVGFMS